MAPDANIGRCVFQYCNKLKKLAIGKNVKNINDGAFADCNELDSIVVHAQTPPTLGRIAFDDAIYSNAKLIVPEGCEDAYMSSRSWYKFYPAGSYVDTEINYEIISDSTVAVVSKESGYLGKVVIPSETVIEGKTYKVTEIGEEAFSRTNAITSITIPNTVTKIGIRAFYSCESLTSMTLPDSLVTIENWAFESCHKLASINLPNSVSTIGFRTFYDCTVLNEVIIPKSLKTIEEEAFAKCNNLTKVVIGDLVENIKNRAFAECNKLTTLTIGSSVKRIESNVFADCGAIDSIVVLAQTPPDLGYEAFASIVYASASLTVPTGSEDAYKNAEGWKNFYKEYHNDEGIWYDELTDTEVTVMAVSSGTSEVVIPSETTIDGVTYTVTTIGKAAFKNCNEVKSVEIPASVTEICETAFQGCSELTEVTIGEISSQGRKNIKRRAVRNTDVTIGSYAFEYCKKLTTLVLGENVTSIGTNTFRECPALVSVTCHAQTPPTLSEGSFDAETYKKATLTVPDGCKDAYKAAEYWKEFYAMFFVVDGIQYKIISDTEVEAISSNIEEDELIIPSQITVDGVTYSVTSIGADAFSWNWNITKVVIPNSVTNIAEGAFYSCDNLSTIVIGSNVKTIGYEAFLNCYNLNMIEVHATTPPTTDVDVFSHDIYSIAMLSVPSGSENAYRAAETWKEFYIVSEITGVEGVFVDDDILGYFNLHGTMSDKPWEGVNIVVYKDGTRRKVVYKF